MRPCTHPRHCGVCVAHTQSFALHKGGKRRASAILYSLTCKISKRLPNIVHFAVPCTTLEVEGLGCHKIPSDELQSGCKLLLELLAAHDFGGLGELAQQLFESSKESDQTALVHVGHFTANKLALPRQEWHEDKPDLRK
jgi:hypothetical protein